jgi:hypothetical protein
MEDGEAGQYGKDRELVSILVMYLYGRQRRQLNYMFFALVATIKDANTPSGDWRRSKSYFYYVNNVAILDE